MNRQASATMSTPTTGVGLESLIGIGAFASFGLAIAVLGIVLKQTLLVCIGLVIAIGLSCFGYIRWRDYRKAAVSDLSLTIVDDLKKRGLKAFSLADAAAGFKLSSGVVRRAAECVYARMVSKALSDFVISENERRILDSLASSLGLDPATATRIENHCIRSRYGAAAAKRLADGEITEIEAAELHRIRSSLGLSSKEALAASRDDVVDVYRAMFRRFISDGVLSDDEISELESFRDATGLSVTEGAQITAQDALDLFRRTVSMTCQDGEVTEAEYECLIRLKGVLGLIPAQTKKLLAQVNRTKQLGRIRAGELPRSATTVHLRASEICHYSDSCTFQWDTPSGNSKRESGQLLVTNQRVIFQSPTKSFEFRPRKVLDIIEYRNAVELQMTTRRGQGRYFVKSPDLLGAIIEALVKYQNRVQLERFNTSRSRHIPDQVRLEVWQRDGGNCVRCSATEYLEFDHIIPFSKGGASTTRNVQLLCRKCNSAKSDEIV